MKDSFHAGLDLEKAFDCLSVFIELQNLLEFDNDSGPMTVVAVNAHGI
jgi:hypothetical protein